MVCFGVVQADLGAVSAEIKDLQERSMGMGVRLKNRKVRGSACCPRGVC